MGGLRPQGGNAASNFLRSALPKRDARHVEPKVLTTAAPEPHQHHPPRTLAFLIVAARSRAGVAIPTLFRLRDWNHRCSLRQGGWCAI